MAKRRRPNALLQSPRRREQTRPLTAVAGVLVAAAIAVTALSPSGDAGPPSNTDLRSPDRFDPAQLRLARAQSLADRFASAFAAYLSGERDLRPLRAAGASPELLGRLLESHQRSDPGSARRKASGNTAYRPGAVSVRVEPNGWLLSTTLTDDKNDDPVLLPLAARIEETAGRFQVTTLDIQATAE